MNHGRLAKKRIQIQMDIYLNKTRGINTNNEFSHQMTENLAGSILVAEDNVITQKLLGAMLGNWGFLVSFVSNGLEAIDHLKKQIFDLIILDYQMPEMNGLETLKLIREDLNKEIKQIPIIIITGEVNQKILTQIENCGVKYFLRKPVQPNELSMVVSQLLPKEINSKDVGVATTKYLRKITSSNNNLMLEIIDVFIEETPKNFHKLKSYCLMEDWQNLRNLLHKIKSNHFYVGLVENEFLISDLEMDLERLLFCETYLTRILQLENNTSNAIVGLRKKRKILFDKLQDFDL